MEAGGRYPETKPGSGRLDLIRNRINGCDDNRRRPDRNVGRHLHGKGRVPVPFIQNAQMTAHSHLPFC
ncbi:hypothetical protein CBFG_00984 [Clostridiales bacterium 1_7_47FAA]|nr:hypothetical protein CBFG_00984 [Clostridiales bacterium 1_7_47FAA]